MSNDINIFTPFVNALVDVTKVTIDIFLQAFKIEPKFNIEDFFKTVELKNKREVYPTQVKIYNSPKGYTYLVSCPPGLGISEFEEYKEAIEIQVRHKVDIRERNGYIEIEVITKELPEVINYTLPTRVKDSIYIPLGESLEGSIGIDLKDHPHTYLVGETGSGKSVCTKGILTSLVNNYRPDEVELHLCDLTMVELALFRSLKHTKKFVFTVEDTTEVIADLLNETLKRYELFMEYGVTNIFEYNKLPGIKKLKYQVLFIEEAVILLEDSKKKAMKLLKRLICISRKSGCYVFMTTQRPSVDIIDATVKAQVSNRIVFAVEDEKNSIICLDSPEAKDLRGKGNGILKVGPTKTEFQSYFISDEQVKNYTRKYILSRYARNHLNTPKNVPNKPIDKTLDNEKEIENRSNTEAQTITDLSFLDNI